MDHIDLNKGIAFGTAALRQSFPIQDGAIFNRERIGVGLEKLRELYASKGCSTLSPVLNDEVDDERGSISIRIDLYAGTCVE